MLKKNKIKKTTENLVDKKTLKVYCDSVFLLSLFIIILGLLILFAVVSIYTNNKFENLRTKVIEESVYKVLTNITPVLNKINISNDSNKNKIKKVEEKIYSVNHKIKKQEEKIKYLIEKIDNIEKQLDSIK